MQPLLETTRLILRPFLVSDAKRVQELAGQKIIADMTANIPHPYLDGMAEQWIEFHSIWWEEKSAIIYAIVKPETDELVGAISITQISGAKGNLGYWIGVPFWGIGICSEAANEIIKFGFEYLELTQIYARHLPGNPVSGKVMKKNGFTYVKNVELDRRELLHYELNKNDWDAFSSCYT